MERRKVITTLLAGALVLPAITHAQPGQGPGGGPGYGSGKGSGKGAGPQQGRWSRERLYGSPLMTLEERQEHQRRMWNAKTTAERQKIRDEHRKVMLERAKQQNTKIDEKQDDVFFVPGTD